MQMNRRSVLKLAVASAVVIPAAAGSSLLLSGCNTNWINVALADLPAAVEIANSVIGIVALATGNGSLTTTAAAAITSGAAAVKVGLTTLQALIADYQASPNSSVLDKIDVALTDIQTNLSSILSVSGIKDQALQVTIATAISLAIATVSTIQTLIPAAPVSSAIRRAGPKQLIKPSIVPNKEQLVSMYNAVVVLNGYAGYQIK